MDRPTCTIYHGLPRVGFTFTSVGWSCRYVFLCLWIHRIGGVHFSSSAFIFPLPLSTASAIGGCFFFQKSGRFLYRGSTISARSSHVRQYFSLHTPTGYSEACHHIISHYPSNPDSRPLLVLGHECYEHLSLSTPHVFGPFVCIVCYRLPIGFVSILHGDGTLELIFLSPAQH